MHGALPAGALNMALACRWATPEDLPALELFLAETYGANSVQALPGRCRWLYFEHPDGLHVTLCEETDGRLVGCCGHLPVTLRVNDRNVTAAFGIDFMVHPAYRRRGIAREMLRLRLEHFDVSLSSGQSEAMGSVYAAHGGSVSFPFHRALRVRRMTPALSPRILARDALGLALALRSPRRKAARRSASLDPALPLPEAADGAAPLASLPSLQWRFQRGPYRDYAVSVLLTDNAPVGAVISRFTADCERILALGGPASRHVDLLNLAARTSPSRAVEVLTTSPGMVVAARSAGYLVRPLDALAVAVSRDASLIAALRQQGLALMAGDSDTDLLRRPRSDA